MSNTFFDLLFCLKHQEVAAAPVLSRQHRNKYQHRPL